MPDTIGAVGVPPGSGEHTRPKQETLDLLQSASYDIAFVDLKMPGMNGWEVAKAIKRIDPNTMVILMTGWRVQVDNKRLKESYVDAVIAKPFELSEISDLIATAIGTDNV